MDCKKYNANAAEARMNWLNAIENPEKKENELMADFPKYLDLTPVKHVSGTVRLPGSKSISNRTLLLSALAEGKTLIKDLLFSDDTQVMLDCLEIFGYSGTKPALRMNMK